VASPAERVVAALCDRGPTTVADLAEELQYPKFRIYDFIRQARAAGTVIRCRQGIDGEASVYAVVEGETA
jgi:predicted transcriptional regulator